MPEIEARVLAGTRQLFELIAQSKNLQALTDNSTGRVVGIVMFRHRQQDAGHLFRHLQHAGVMCAPRGGGIRFSPHFIPR